MSPLVPMLHRALAFLVAFAAMSTAQSPASLPSSQVHPVEVSPDGTRLFVVNTPDARLAVFDLRDPTRPLLLGEVEVGLEPVSVRARDDGEVWVVAQLADSIQVVDVDRLECVATIECSDEPADVVFAAGRAFVACATAREVLVFDPVTRARVASIPVFGDEPRALAASADRVWVASWRSGNRTTVVPADLAPPQPPPSRPGLPPAPAAGLIVDATDPTWRAAHGVTLTDEDVFEIDARTLAVVRSFVGAGTMNFGLALRPGAGELWVTNTDARNRVRFEPALRGHVVDNRVTRIALGAAPSVVPIDLNPGLDYAMLPNPGALATALAQPMGACWSPSGDELYVAAFGSDRVGVLDAGGAVIARIEIGTTPGTRVARREKRGPRGLRSHTALAEFAIGHDPLPRDLREARGFLYDAKLSGNGTASCASCHVDAVHDGIAWDLGDPGGTMRTVTDGGVTTSFHPMKGPMLTQTLQGIAESGRLHWRGDRADFAAFDVTFADLLGGAVPALPDMADFARFANTIRFPPNPNLHRDRSLPAVPAPDSALDGLVFFTTEPFFGTDTCSSCHRLPTGTNRAIVPASTLLEAQSFEVPGLRGIYGRLPASGPNGARTSGFGVSHDGSRKDVVDLHERTPFHLYDGSLKLQNYLLHLDTGTAPVVGWTHGVDRSNHADPALAAAWNLLETRAALGECDLVARGVLDGEPIGLLFAPATGTWRRDVANAPTSTRAQLETLLAAGRLRITLFGALPGDGLRVALDEDLDGVLDGDARATTLGAGTAGCSLALRTNREARLGDPDFALVASGAPAAARGVVLLASASTVWRGFGLDLLVDPLASSIVEVAADGRGIALVLVPIPADPVLAGTTLHCQSVFIAACGPNGLGASQALRIALR
ncbi:MAG: hypothetical protein HZB39_02335 [Planctomycetes bacterium]|nr:hypothetical protein [Planctomycetota bacterium]